MGGGKDKRHVQIQDPKFQDPYFFEHVGALQRARSFVHPGQLQSEHNKELLQQKRRSGLLVNPRGKPAMQIYRPPTLRHCGAYDLNGDTLYGSKSAYDMFYPKNKGHSANSAKRKSGLNIYAKEFQPDTWNGGIHHSKSGNNLKVANGSLVNSVNHFQEREYKQASETKVKFGATTKGSGTESYGSGPNPIKRSKSLGSADLLRALNESQVETVENLESFPLDTRKVISAALTDPSEIGARQLMEVVRHVFSHVIETSRYSEPTARLCIKIIEKETGETFLETLLNTCQEYYQERDRLLRNSSNNGIRGSASSHPRWIAYMSFLNEMYTQLKRHHSHLMTTRMKNDGTPPGLLLLTLIAQCCYVSLQKAYVNSMSEIECLFFVLTSVGKDIETKLPQQMECVMSGVRDAFFTTVHVPAVRKTLLQLIEMHAAKWQLPAQAVMYYYPGSCAKISNGGI